MCFGSSTAPNTNVTPAPYSVNNSQSAVTETVTKAAATTPSTQQPDKSQQAGEVTPSPYAGLGGGM
jgi:hypothetical protein